MLCLSRRPQEAIRISDAIKIQVLEVRGDNVRLGIEAPRDVTVLREEVYIANNSRTTRRTQSSSNGQHDG